MDILSPFVFLRIVIIFKGAFPFALWILFPWVQVLLFITSFISLLKYLDRLVIVSLFLCEIPDSSSAFLWPTLPMPSGEHCYCSLFLVLFLSVSVFAAVFRVRSIGTGWCWVGYIGSWSSKLYASYFSWLLPATGNSTLCLFPKHCSHLDTDAPASAVWSHMGREAWAQVALSSCLTTVPQLFVSCPSYCLLLASTVSSHGASFISFHVLWQYSLWAVLSVLDCAFL